MKGKKMEGRCIDREGCKSNTLIHPFLSLEEKTRRRGKRVRQEGGVRGYDKKAG